MMKAFAASALFGSLLFPLRGLAATSGLTTVNATGQATVSAAPDIAIVNFSITSHASTAQQATSANNGIYARFSSGMRALGIAASDVKTTGYNLNYSPPPPPCPPPGVMAANATPCERNPQDFGYFVTRSASVTVHKLDIVGKAIDSAVAAGVNNIQGVEYSISDSKSYYLRALGEAIVAARTQADVMAQAAGLRIVRVLSINSSGAIPRPIVETPMYRLAAGVAQPTQITPPSSLDVTANVGVSYAAQP
jgi:uncharacterized protein YggE